MPMQRTMRTLTSKLILPVAVLAVWAFLGEASQARAGYTSSAALRSSQVSSPWADGLLDAPAPVEANCAIASCPVPVDEGNPGNRLENQSSPLWQLLRMFVHGSLPLQAGTGAAGTGTTGWDRLPRKQVAPLSSPTGSPPKAKHSSVVTENDDSPPDGLVCLPFRPPRLVEATNR